MKDSRGFTLIELIVVIVILGLLAATALPRFVDIATDAKTAAIKGVASAMTSASSINYGSRKLTTGYGTAVNSCSDITAMMQGGVPNADFSITDAAVAVNAVVTCTLSGASAGQYSGGAVATFVVTGIS